MLRFEMLLSRRQLILLKEIRDAFLCPAKPQGKLWSLMNQIHGHEVLKMMLKSPGSYTRAGLTEEIIRTFGAEARFCTCSAENMSATELVDFLQAKGKFVSTEEDRFTTSEDLMCQH